MVAKEGVFIFKKFLICILFILFLIPVVTIKANSHPEFQEIILPYVGNAQLIEDMSQSQIKNAYKKVKRRFMGWNVYAIVRDIKVDYVGDTVFAKANNTSNTLSFVHTFEVEDSLETSVSVSGDIHLDVGIKGKKVTTAVDSRVRAEIGRKTKKTTTETLKTTIVIPANTKVTVTIKGTARLNNGVAKYFFFGIGTKKGTWEYIDIINEYYDYYEEAI